MNFVSGQSLPLEAKITMSLQRIREWHEHWDGQVYVSFSGGKDSSVLLHLVRSLYPEVPAALWTPGWNFLRFAVSSVLWRTSSGWEPGEALSGNRAGIRLSRGQQGYREKRILRAEGQQLGIAPVSGDRIRTARRPNGTLPGRKSGKSCWTRRLKSAICAVIG